MIRPGDLVVADWPHGRSGWTTVWQVTLERVPAFWALPFPFCFYLDVRPVSRWGKL